MSCLKKLPAFRRESCHGKDNDEHSTYVEHDADVGAGNRLPVYRPYELQKNPDQVEQHASYECDDYQQAVDAHLVDVVQYGTREDQTASECKHDGGENP